MHNLCTFSGWFDATPGSGTVTVPPTISAEGSQGFAVEKNDVLHSTVQPRQVISVFRGFLLRFFVFSTRTGNFPVRTSKKFPS